MITIEPGEIALIIGAALRIFASSSKLGRVGVGISHQNTDDLNNICIPAVSFISGKRPKVTEGVVPQMPDLAVEIKSPKDSLKDLRDKAMYYMEHGARLVWIVDPAKHIVIVLSPDDEQILLEHETLDGGDVLPEFSLPLKDIFADPLADQ